jgi:hypothetical protein
MRRIEFYFVQKHMVGLLFASVKGKEMTQFEINKDIEKSPLLLTELGEVLRGNLFYKFCSRIVCQDLYRFVQICSII